MSQQPHNNTTDQNMCVSLVPLFNHLETEQMKHVVGTRAKHFASTWKNHLQ
ncbi:hypothetical protein [Sporosarcina sp. P16b]|uniref:hypothetical protein n=1 Tax=Sporosarcina sp. P16b TaxID=2048261 RepID=UPI001E3EDCB9|nr:hypothetical protein [Sporosarcina sp. P16b]